MKNQLISEITRQMIPYLDNAQMEQLQEVLQHTFWNVQITANENGIQPPDRETNAELLDMFLSAKRVEGCSDKTLRYYETSIRRLFAAVDCHVTHMQTDDLRTYLSDYQQQTQCSKGNIDNIRRIMSSFFTWLEDENYILKSPVRRIHKIRSNKTVKETYTDEAMETMRDQCGCLRDLAMIDLLASTGMRVGELVHLNRMILTLKTVNVWFSVKAAKSVQYILTPVQKSISKTIWTAEPTIIPLYSFLCSVHTTGWRSVAWRYDCESWDGSSVSQRCIHISSEERWRHAPSTKECR